MEYHEATRKNEINLHKLIENYIQDTWSRDKKQVIKL